MGGECGKVAKMNLWAIKCRFVGSLRIVLRNPCKFCVYGLFLDAGCIMHMLVMVQGRRLTWVEICMFTA